MDSADLYLNQIDYYRYLSQAQCHKCGPDSCKELIDQIKNGSAQPFMESCLPEEILISIKAVIAVEESVPDIPKIQLPRPGPTGLTRLNNPDDGDPILVTGNSIFTQEVLLTVLSQTEKPFFLVCVDTNGDTLDMAVILGTFNPESVKEALELGSLEDKAGNSTIIIPGKAAHLLDPIKAATQWSKIEEGPVCGVELPLFLGDRW